MQTTDRAAVHSFGRVASLLLLLAGLALAGCGPNYSPNTYSGTAVQQANKADQAVVVGVRKIDISAQTNTGALAGGGLGGVAGSTAGDSLGIGSALGAIGGTVLGGIVGSTVEHTTADTQGYEYIARKTNGELVSVTQKDATPLAIGTRVLIIAGNQARIVPDYTVALESDKPPASAGEQKPPASAGEQKPPASAGEQKPPASAGEQKPPASAEEKTPDAKSAETAPVPAGDPKPPVAEAPKGANEAEAAPAAAHVVITEAPLATEQASPEAPASAAAEPPHESKPEGPAP